ncbi:asparagine synthase (glutamine-hydrolyzing) [Marinobacter mobilis]|uniref:asparagine synthase (glutamine-hydrolyzing) n=1 Tax=Marinobacter mobilis TaxID=488533 RepID=A0A1H2UW83_9GAMM|nr:asparagine synthase (glutamine-hydrolyzing) [Marinobacter mobilis]SDW60258.1 asparagine synthase (glutamine-hydrolysing) [Marinobacter mobilis]
MCGIAGIVNFNNGSYKENLEKMKDSISHRGPDGYGIEELTGANLVHTRLSIVDLEGGKQPMYSTDGRFCITFNGEIYGFKELAKETGYNFSTCSDTEVILAMYIKYGKSMMSKLSGMFSFAIWDNLSKSLFCARDRFGEKPFYYAFGRSGEFVFASEPKSIIASGLISNELDENSICHYLKKLYVHPSTSIYKKISVLRPGFFLEVNKDGVNETRYWSFPDTRKDSVTLDQAVETVSFLLKSSVEKQLIADVPIGAFLSGGVDSSSVVSVASSIKPDLMTMSYRFKSGFDEGEYAKTIAEIYGTNHIELYEEPFDLLEILKNLSFVYDEPFADSSSVPTYQICKEASKHCKVALTGDGADELFGGYTWKYRPLVYQAIFGNSNYFRTLALYIVSGILKSFSKKALNIHRYYALKNVVLERDVNSSVDDLYWFFSDKEISKLGVKKTSDNLERWFDGSGRLLDFNDALKVDLSDYMVGDILVKTDRASMANGLELRSPFLDKELAEYVISLPGRLKLDKKSDKIILRTAFAKQWPDRIKYRSKQGFGSPIEGWLTSPSLDDAKDFYFSKDSRISKFLNPDQVQAYKNSNDSKTWALLIFSMWCERWAV